MSSFLRILKILETGSPVQSCPVVEEKQIARLERETSLQFFSLAHFVQKIDRLLLLRSEIGAIRVRIRPVNKHPQVGAGKKGIFPGKNRLHAKGGGVCPVNYMTLEWVGFY